MYESTFPQSVHALENSSVKSPVSDRLSKDAPWDELAQVITEQAGTIDAFRPWVITYALFETTHSFILSDSMHPSDVPGHTSNQADRPHLYLLAFANKLSAQL